MSAYGRFAISAFIAFSLVSLLFVTGCGTAATTTTTSGSTTTSSDSRSLTVSVSPSSVSLSAGQSQTFTVTVSGAGNSKVNWLVNGIAGGNSSVGIISSSGSYTAPSPVPSSSVTVSAVRSLFLGTPVASELVQALAWMAGVVIVFAPLAVRRYRRAV